MQPEQTAATPSETEDFAFILPEETDAGNSAPRDEDTAFLQPEQDAAGDSDIPAFLTEAADTTDTAESTKPGETVEETDFTFEDFAGLPEETDAGETDTTAEEPAMQPEQTAATPSETEDFAFILPEETDAGNSAPRDEDTAFLQPEQDNSIEQEISIDDFLTPSENISIQPANDSLSFADGEISLDAFFDSPTDESISLDNFLPSEKKEKNDIINDPPINIDLSFDDAFVLNTKADPVGQVENIGPGLQTDFIDTSENDDFDFDEMFDNLIDETEPATEPHEESKEPESSIQYDEVSDFDDILETIESDSTPATQETAQKNTYTAVTDYDITVSTDDEDIQEVRSIQTDTDDEDSIEDISLFIGNESNSAENNDLYLDRSQTSEYTKTSYTDDDFDLDKIISEVEDIGGNMLDIPENEQNTDNSQQIHIPSDSSDTNDIFNVDYFETNDTDSGTPESEQVHIPDVSNTLESDDILASDQDFSMPTETFENSDGEKTAAYDFSDQEFSMLTENSGAVDDITPIIEEPTPYIDEFAELPEEPVLESDNTENIPVTTEDTDSTLYNITENHINESGSSEPNDSPILNKIADELFSLKEEISVLKQDFENLKKHGFVKSETGTISSDEVLQSSADAIDGGFFDDTTDDDTIALSGDELTNILNTADFTEEGFVDTEITENDIHLDSPETNPPASETLTPVASETTDINGDFCEPIILEQEDNFVSCSQETEYDLQTQKDIAQSDEILPEDNFVPESSTDEPVDTFTTEAVSEDDTATLSEEETAFSPEPELPEDIFVPESSTDEPVDTFTTEAVSEDDTATLSEEKTAFSPEPELPEEIDIPTETEPEDTTASRSETIEDVAEIEFPESLTEEEITDEPAETVFESEQWIQPPIDILTDDQVTAEPPVTAQETESIPANLKEDIKSVLAYMDQLLDNLPEEKIEEFARSEHFELYKKLFTELGLS